MSGRPRRRWIHENSLVRFESGIAGGISAGAGRRTWCAIHEYAYNAFEHPGSAARTAIRARDHPRGRRYGFDRLWKAISIWNGSDREWRASFHDSSSPACSRDCTGWWRYPRLK
jgi:hypothetical protein